MANPDYPPGHFFKDRYLVPGVIAKGRKASDHDRKLAAAYAEVDAREGNVCQVSGVALVATSANKKRRREHHHLKGRNVKPEWVYESRRILLCSSAIHELLQAKVILVDGTDATKPLVFTWNRRMVKPSKEPMRLEKVMG